jgi:subtilisin family serine protease
MSKEGNMNISRAIQIALPILVVLRLLLPDAPPAAVRSESVAGQEGSLPVTAQERIVSENGGLAKLSADLQEMLAATPISGRLQAYNLEADNPLLVTALVEPGASVERSFIRSVRSRQVAGVEWVTGEIDLFQLRKLASSSQVLGVISPNSFQAAEAPGLDDLRASPEQINTRQLRQLLAQGGPAKLLEQVNIQKQEMLSARPAYSGPSAMEMPQFAVSSAHDLLSVHDVQRVRDAGYGGEGVTVGVVDTGVDFSHPDLRGTQALIHNDGPYSGWAFAYDTVSGIRYAMDASNTLGPDNYWDQAGITGYVHTLPVENANCAAATCSGDLLLEGDAETGVTLRFTWPNTSRSGQYYYSLHPDYALALYAYYMEIGYPEGWLLPPVLIVSDKDVAGVYDTVYVDVNFNQMLTEPIECMSRGTPFAGAILTGEDNKDEVWDLSAGLLAWISDGENQPPGVSVLYPEITNNAPPGPGRMIVFIMDQDGHGTSCASLIAGQSQITDPFGKGPSNTLYAGGEEVGGVGGPVITAMAPGAKIAAFQNGFRFPFDSWALAVLGMDGDAATDDGVNIVSNSWGDSQIIPDGWDVTSRFAQNLSYIESPTVSFLVATGNGGHGYGTLTAPGGGSIIDVGASTAYGSLRGFEYVDTGQFLYGDVQPWSNRGPGMLGDPAPEIVAVGAWGAAAIPLNRGWGDGQQAYDIFGGTSMSTPVAAGGMAFIYQTFRLQNGRWPTWEEARDILLTSASSLGYEAYSQGSGNIQIGRAVDMVQSKTPAIAPSQWQAGGYGSDEYPAFPAIMHAGEQDAQTFTVRNPLQHTITANLHDSLLQSFHEETFTFSISTTDVDGSNGLPIFLKDITGWIDQSELEYAPDLVRAQVVLPFTNFDVSGDVYADSWWSVYFYDWMDRNNDGNLWVDENQNGRVDNGEIDIDPVSGLAEFNRFTYGYPQSDYIEASLGGQSMSRRHDGIFLGLGCIFCGESTTLQVRVVFYRQVDWDWLTLSHSTLEVEGESVGEITAAISVPPDALPGAYEGGIGITIDGVESTLPVTVQVAASSTTFTFGGTESLELPYDNAHIFGGFNWNWRYEAGDWRLFYADIPDETAEQGKVMVVDTLWNAPATDIDTWLFGPAEDGYAQRHPEYFGPHGLSLSTGSEDSYLMDGKFAWKTNTGTARELVAAPVKDGLNLIVLHDVLNSGLQFAEPYIGRVFQIASDPGQVVFTLDPDGHTPPYLTGTQKITLTSTSDIREGLQIQAFGMSPPIDLLHQLVQQDSPSNICSATWVYNSNEGGLEIYNGGLLEIATISTASNLDVDLYLFRDNGDGKWNCGKDTLKTYSIGDTAEEKIKIYFPEDGRYWVVVHGNRVPDNQNRFDLRIRSISGTDLTLGNIPMGVVHAGDPVEFTLNYHGNYSSTIPTVLEGLLLIGTPAVPGLLEMPVQAQPTILLRPAPGLRASSRWVAQTPVTFTLAVQNLGANPENTLAHIPLPEELVYAPGSASGPGEIIYDPGSHALSWYGVIGGAERVILSFQATAQPGIPPKRVDLLAQVNGVTSGQEWPTSTAVWINQYGLLFPLVRR